MSIEEYQDFTTVYANGFYNGEEKWKNKIRAKIKELEEEQKEYKGGQEWEIQDDIDAQINILKQLLEEN